MKLTYANNTKTEQLEKTISSQGILPTPFNNIEKRERLGSDRLRPKVPEKMMSFEKDFTPIIILGFLITLSIYCRLRLLGLWYGVSIVSEDHKRELLMLFYSFVYRGKDTDEPVGQSN